MHRLTSQRPQGASVSQVLKDMRWGLQAGLGVGALYCLWSLAAYLLRGPEVFKRHGVTLGALLFLYLFAGGASGMIVGFLWRFTTTRAMAYAVGLAAGLPVALGTARFERHLAKSGIPLLIDFWAPWCGPCRVMAPEFERAAALLEPAVRLVKINVDEEPAPAQRFRVQTIPTLALAFEGSELARAAGARSAAQLVDWTRAALAQAQV